ncbi:MAG: 50S ribosomal protein L4 [Fibrobacteraceae bacterium]|nr:50S ribosomal protein L4 [Fibrobacteraceae bacterium]
MAKAKLYAASGEFKNEMDLPAVFDSEINKVCIYLHIKAILNNRRQGTAETKSKSLVSGGTMKPWKQKGTGRARSGQNTSSVWVRGNKAHGPKAHDYFEKVNKKVKLIAFHSALSDKAKEGKVLVFEKLAFSAPKTKDFLAVMDKAGLEKRNALFLIGSKDANLLLSSSNVPWVRTARVQDVNTYDLVRANNIAISQDALGELTGGSR